jgi:hypothetical protein
MLRVKYCREGGPESPIWHINQRDWHLVGGDVACTTIGYCSRIFRPERVSDERPDERMICCVCLAVEKMKANT